jgi:dimeric dUTPase (all-alpha-NTP-PPase superfamily)
MNVTDFDDTELPSEDLLKAMFEKQAELMKEYHDIEKNRGANVVEDDRFGALDNRFVQWRLKDLAYRAVEELSEATNCLKNKPWKQSEVATDRVHFYEELVDALHFFLELCITAGLDAEDLALLYLKKARVNEFRQRSNY